MKRQFIFILMAVFAIVILPACGGSGEGSDPNNGGSDSIPENGNPDKIKEKPVRGGTIRIHHLSDPDKLHPINARSANAREISHNIFLYLVDYDPITFEPIPVLAKALPEVSPDKKEMTFEIREEAVWADGKPITGHDYIFTIKAIKNPLTESNNQRLFYEAVRDIQVDPGNPKRFTVYLSDNYYMNEVVIGGTVPLPKHFYDRDGLMDKFTIAQLNQESEALSKNPDIIAFAEFYDGDDVNRNPEYSLGSGPYRLKEWLPGQRVTLERNEDWWGDKITENRTYYHNAWPDRLVFKTIPDPVTATTALKAGEVDVVTQIPPETFAEFRDGKASMADQFLLENPTMFAYTYILMNMCPERRDRPFFQDLKVRKAFCHLMNVPMMIENVLYGLGTHIVSPISPLLKDIYNDEIQPYAFDPEKAVQLLEEAGWKDSNGDGVRDKIVNGKKLEMEVGILIRKGSNISESIARFLAAEAKRVGVKVNPVIKPFNNQIELVRKHEYDLFLGASGAAHLPPDLKQSLHTSSISYDGSNYNCFGTPETDSLLEAIRFEQDDQKRNQMYLKLQEILYESAHAIYMHATQKRIAISKRIKGAHAFSMRPYVWPASWWADPVVD